MMHNRQLFLLSCHALLIGSAHACFTGNAWTDNVGETCTWYEKNEPLGCPGFSSFPGNNGQTAGQACCHCRVHDECNGAIRLYQNEKISGDNSYSNTDFDDADACGANSDYEGVWYEIVGAGQEIALSLCTINERILSVGVFDGCGSENCFGFPSKAFSASNCDKDESLDYSWFAESGQSYFVHVRANVVNLSNLFFGAKFEIVYRSANPTAAPTAIPSASPSLPPVPTLEPTQGGVVFSEDGTVTSCRVSPPEEGWTTGAETIEFEYVLPNTAMISRNAGAKIAEIEMNLHTILSYEIFQCLYDNGPFTIFELSKGDADTISSNPCLETESCFLVNAKLSIKVAYAVNRRRLANEVIDSLIPFLTNALNTLGCEFQGFTNLDADGTDDSQNGANIAGPESNITRKGTEDPGILVFLSAAAIVLMMTLGIFIIIRRRRVRRFENHVNEVSELDLDSETKMKVESPGHQVDDDDLIDDDEQMDDVFQRDLEDLKKAREDAAIPRTTSKVRFIPTHVDMAGFHKRDDHDEQPAKVWGFQCW